MNNYPRIFRELGLSCIACILYAALLCADVLAAPSPQITIDGGPAILRDNVRHYLSIADEDCSAPLWRLKSLLNDAQTETEKAAQAVGFYHLTFTSKLTQENQCWQLFMQLTPNQEVKVQKLNLVINGEGVDDKIFKLLYENPEIKLGDRLNHGFYENLKNRITILAASHGYFDGRFETSSITVNTEENTADIELIYDTGIRYRIGEIRFNQNIFADDFVRRYLNFKSGDYYDTDKLLELKTLYNATNYFNIATASPDLQHLQDHKVDVDIALEERKRRAYSVGLGAGTDTGPRILLGFEDRYVNDYGHSIKADFSYSNVKETGLIAYNVPMEKPSYEFLKFYVGYDKEDLDTLYSYKKTLGGSYSYYLDSHWLHTYAINIENEFSQVADDPDIYTHLVIPSVTLSRTETDGSPYPLKGWSFISRLSGSPKTLGSDLSLIQFYSRAKYIHAFSVGRLLLRSELGATQGDDIDKIPASIRFFAGGDNSVRGYDYKSLGPTETAADGTKKVVGGNSLWVNSIEYDYLFRPNWAVAAFYDIGNAADNFHVPMQRGTGLGIRWISPIGPVRVDVARALDFPNGWQLHISMGPDL